MTTNSVAISLSDLKKFFPGLVVIERWLFVVAISIKKNKGEENFYPDSEALNTL